MDLKLPKISIVTVVLNQDKKIERSIKSVLNQNYPKNKIELIVIDGGSKDKTLTKIKKYKKQIKYWHSKKDKGLWDAMNIGIKKTSGDIIGILNADDYFYKNALKIVSKYFVKNKIDFLFGSVLKKRIYHNFKLVDTLNKNISKSEIIIFKGCSHNVHLEKPNQFNNAIKDFLL